MQFNPASARVALEMAQAFSKAGVPFVCIPALSDEQYQQLVAMLADRLEFVIGAALEGIENAAENAD